MAMEKIYMAGAVIGARSDEEDSQELRNLPMVQHSLSIMRV